MGNAFSLDAIREATIRKYAPVDVELTSGETVTLRPLVKLRKHDRTTVMDAVQKINNSEQPEDDSDEELVQLWAAEICDLTEVIFRVLTPAADELIADLEHDDMEVQATLHTSVLGRWFTGTQAGEAESSPS